MIALLGLQISVTNTYIFSKEVQKVLSFLKVVLGSGENHKVM